MNEIVIAFAALYGAALSTIAIVLHFKNQRCNVRLTITRDRRMTGHSRFDGLTLTEINATNLGLKPVTMTSFAAIGLFPHPSIACMDTQPQLPCEIAEGEFISSYWDQAILDSSEIDYWAAWDSRGKVYKLHEASRFKHWKSNLQQRRELRNQNKTGGGPET